MVPLLPLEKAYEETKTSRRGGVRGARCRCSTTIIFGVWGVFGRKTKIAVLSKYTKMRRKKCEKSLRGRKFCILSISLSKGRSMVQSRDCWWKVSKNHEQDLCKRDTTFLAEFLRFCGYITKKFLGFLLCTNNETIQ